jgi:hypothetical protein
VTFSVHNSRGNTMTQVLDDIYTRTSLFNYVCTVASAYLQKCAAIELLGRGEIQLNDLVLQHDDLFTLNGVRSL